jgi:hypothetical protein
MKQINILVAKNDFSSDGITSEAMESKSPSEAIQAVTNMLTGISSGASDGAALIGYMYDGSPSTVTLTVDNAVNGDTVTIGGVTLEAGVNFDIGGDDASTLSNVLDALSSAGLFNLVRSTLVTPESCLFTSLYIQNLSFLNTSGTGGFSFSSPSFEGSSDFGYKVCTFGLNPEPEDLFLG